MFATKCWTCIRIIRKSAKKFWKRLDRIYEHENSEKSLDRIYENENSEKRPDRIYENENFGKRPDRIYENENFGKIKSITVYIYKFTFIQLNILKLKFSNIIKSNNT